MDQIGCKWTKTRMAKSPSGKHRDIRPFGDFVGEVALAFSGDSSGIQRLKLGIGGAAESTDHSKMERKKRNWTPTMGRPGRNWVFGAYQIIATSFDCGALGSKIEVR